MKYPDGYFVSFSESSQTLRWATCGPNPRQAHVLLSGFPTRKSANKVFGEIGNGEEAQFRGSIQESHLPGLNTQVRNAQPPVEINHLQETAVLGKTPVHQSRRIDKSGSYPKSVTALEALDP